LADADDFFQTAEAALERHAAGIEFRRLPSDADADVQAAPRQMVERRQLLGEDGGRAEGSDQNPCGQSYATGSRRHRAQQHERIEPVEVDGRGHFAIRILIETLAHQDMFRRDKLIDAGLVHHAHSVEQAFEIPVVERIQSRQAYRRLHNFVVSCLFWFASGLPVSPRAAL